MRVKGLPATLYCRRGSKGLLYVITTVQYCKVLPVIHPHFLTKQTLASKLKKRITGAKSQLQYTHKKYAKSQKSRAGRLALCKKAVPIILLRLLYNEIQFHEVQQCKLEKTALYCTP